MSTLNNLRKQADKDASEFKKNFLHKYGMMPRVIYNIDSMSQNVSLITEIELATNKVVENYFPGIYAKGIKTPSKKREIIQFKNLFYFIGLDEGWTQVELSKHIGHKDHTSALHGQRHVEALMQDRDMQTLIYHSDILAELKNIKIKNTQE